MLRQLKVRLVAAKCILADSASGTRAVQSKTQADAAIQNIAHFGLPFTSKERDDSMLFATDCGFLPHDLSRIVAAIDLKQNKADTQPDDSAPPDLEYVHA